MSHPISLAQAPVGTRVEQEFLVRDRAEKVTRTGNPFVVLTLANSTGVIETAPIWSERLEWAQGAEKGKVVAVIGEVAMFGDAGARRRQLDLKAPLRVLLPEQFDPTAFLPRIDAPTEQVWDALDKLRGSIKSARVRAAVDLFFADDAFRVQFERTPGAVNGHHAQLGGLLLHVFEVTDIARYIARTVRKADQDLVIAGAMLHDIGKVEAYAVNPEGFSHTTTGMLLGHVTLGALMFDRRLRDSRVPFTDAQRDELLHFILSHHGALEFGSPVQPMTTEAEIVHWADEASAKATDFIDEYRDAELFPPGETNEMSAKRSWRLSRRIWRRPAPWD
ncbi:MAG: HD domain-containing protein [Gemmatimonadaceae bacterium]|nr:HD domain-containing protein [Gemmatimonadaceae bacterium]